MVKAVRMVGRFGGLTAAIAVLGLAGGCTALRSHQGYIIDADLVNSVQPGVDNRTSVIQTLGKPSFASQFNNGEWYYVARDSRNLAYMNPKARSQVTLKVAFDQQGVVSNITRTGLDQVASVRPYGKVTPTLGRKRSFFEELFGNIGSVGAAGAGTGGGGDDSQP
jgi:outer membrane protein assembly factor BamE (lipoprotein component of BamABCDE complex)